MVQRRKTPTQLPGSKLVGDVEPANSPPYQIIPARKKAPCVATLASGWCLQLLSSMLETQPPPHAGEPRLRLPCVWRYTAVSSGYTLRRHLSIAGPRSWGAYAAINTKPPGRYRQKDVRHVGNIIDRSSHVEVRHAPLRMHCWSSSGKCHRY